MKPEHRVKLDKLKARAKSFCRVLSVLLVIGMAASVVVLSGLLHHVHGQQHESAGCLNDGEASNNDFVLFVHSFIYLF
jgi:hypothetical protein